MRATAITLLALVSVASLAACGRAKAPGESASTHIAAADAPPAPAAERRPGLWEQRVSDGQNAAVTRICLDAASETALGDYGRAANARCEKHDMALVAPGMWRFSTVCDMGPEGKVTTDGTVSGDFNAHYQVAAESSTLGQDGRRRLLVDATWQGACPAGMKAGEVLFPDGRRESVANLAPAAGR